MTGAGVRLTPHEGATVALRDGSRYVLSSRALPTGWWAIPAGGGRPVRLVQRQNTWQEGDK